jgi:hypothetical protein
VAKTGSLISTRATFNAAYASGGAHGYDNADLLMRALFIGHGRAFAPARRVAGAESVDIQPLLARLLGLRAPAGDGDPARFRSALTR